MDTRKIYRFPVRERWRITADTGETHPGVTCVRKDEGPQLVVMIQAASMDEVPGLVQRGQVLLERERNRLYSRTT